MSDTHGRTGPCQSAVKLLGDLGVNTFIHCGDVGEWGRPPEPVFDELAGTGCRFVWGNNDAAEPAAARYAADLGLMLLEPLETVHLGSQRVQVAHGDEHAALRRLAADAETKDVGVDLLLTGHSHVTHDRQHGLMRWVNPGALHRASDYTVATIDLRHLSEPEAVRHHIVPR